MSKPILYIDDDLATGRPRLEATGLDLFREKSCQDVFDDRSISEALQDTKIVLMDYGLHDDGASSSAPLDGLELLERFRARIRRHHDQGASAPLLTIYTNQISRLAAEHDECPVVPYMLARRANVDWVFEKQAPSDGEDAFGRQLEEMLRAFDLEIASSGGEVERQLATFLGLPEPSDWSELALEQLLDMRPPVQKDLSRPGARVALLRWLLQVALPFPGCFVSLDSIAVRFRLPPRICPPRSLETPSRSLPRLLDRSPLSRTPFCFFPTRYWKAGIDYIVWRMTEGRSPANPTVRQTIAERSGKSFHLIEVADPVLVVSPETFELTGDIARSMTRFRSKPTYGPQL
jgi:hypothetical protein